MSEDKRPTEERELLDLDPLTGKLVRLRELHEEDLPSLTAWWNDPQVSTYQRFSPQPQPQAGLTDMVRGWSRNEGSDCGLSIVHKKSGELLGHVGLYGATAKDRCATFAIVLGPEHHGRGFGTDAARVALRYGFMELGLHRVELGVFGFNGRAVAAYTKAGFKEEGRRRQAIWRTGGWHDHIMMSILADEWRD